MTWVDPCLLWAEPDYETLVKSHSKGNINDEGKKTTEMNLIYDNCFQFYYPEKLRSKRIVYRMGKAMKKDNKLYTNSGFQKLVS